MPERSLTSALDAALSAVSEERITARINELASIGGLPDGGVTRLGLSADEERARELVSGWLKALGYTQRRDDACNLFCAAIDGPRIMIGSHLDSVPQGGRYDGALGVIAAVEVAEATHAAGLRLPLEVVAWTDEEGARFGTGLFGSAATFGQLSESAWQRRDKQGVSVSDAAAALLGRALVPGTCRRNTQELRAYLELHIEQGPILAAQGLPVGLVSDIVGITHGYVHVIGKSDHAGTTPMDQRHDALAAAAECILVVERIARESRGQLVGTVGEITIAPGAKNVVPGTCTFSLDFRSASDDVRHGALLRASRAIEEICGRRGVRSKREIVNDLPAVAMSPTVLKALEASAEVMRLPAFHLPSGAGHDAQHAARAGVPTGMVFVRSTGGSHNPAEHATGQDAALGVRMLLMAAHRLADGRAA